MKRLALVALVIPAIACGSDPPTQPSQQPNTPTFVATLLPANETTPVAAAEQTGNGNVTITMNVVRDANQAITSATATFVVNLAGFPAGTGVTAAHIHPGAAGTAGGALISLGIASGEITLASGSGQFTKSNINVPATDATNILNNPAGFYFNVHSAASPQGFARGQLVRTQ
jgi:CHRD domain-containing protein